jgi:hypothetical protein
LIFTPRALEADNVAIVSRDIKGILIIDFPLASEAIAIAL